MTCEWRRSTVGCGARWWKAGNGTSACVAPTRDSIAEVGRIRTAMRAVLNEAGWVDEVKGESKGGCLFVFFSVCFMVAERSRCEDFGRVLEQVSGHAHSGYQFLGDGARH